MSVDVEQRLQRLEERLGRLEQGIEDARRAAERRARTATLVRLGLLVAVVLVYVFYLRSVMQGL